MYNEVKWGRKWLFNLGVGAGILFFERCLGRGNSEDNNKSHASNTPRSGPRQSLLCNSIAMFL